MNTISNTDILWDKIEDWARNQKNWYDCQKLLDRFGQIDAEFSDYSCEYVSSTKNSDSDYTFIIDITFECQPRKNHTILSQDIICARVEVNITFSGNDTSFIDDANYWNINSCKVTSSKVTSSEA